MFWDNFKTLCTQAGKAPNTIAKELGIPSGSITAWSNGTNPRNTTLVKIADYFGVTTDYLISDIKKELAIPEDDELLRKINSRPKVKELVTLLVEMDDDQLAAFLKLFSRP